MAADAAHTLRGQRALLATMHGKEQVIAPLLLDQLGLTVETRPDIDTDRFGTFSGEVERSGSPLDAARAKIEAAFALAPEFHIALASEGSFGPHPAIPFVPLAREIVLLIDRKSGLELAGHHSTSDTNFAHSVARTADEAVEFAVKAGFPAHGVIVIGCAQGRPAPELGLFKGIGNAGELIAAAAQMIGRCGSALVQTDMRAHRNPRRMQTIELAARDLVRLFNSRCPNCRYPGYDVSELIPGLPCEECGLPTDSTLARLFTCRACKFQERKPAASQTSAHPRDCANCNP